MASSEYQSPFSVAKRQTLYIDANDPRVRGFMASLTAAKAGAEIVIVGDKSIYGAGAFSFLKGAGQQQGNRNLDPTSPDFQKPSTVTNLSAEWQDLPVDGATLVIQFDFDFSDEANKFVDKFVYNLTKLDNSFTTINIESKVLNKSGTGQTIKFTESMNSDNFAEFQSDFAKLEVAAVDSFGNPGEFAILTNIPAYQNDLPTPVITVTSIIQGYSVDWQTVPNQFEFITIEEVVSDAATAPTSGYEQVYLGVRTIKPAKVITPTSEPRWVRARFNNKGTLFSEYSNVVKVTPTNPISADLIPPSEVTAASASWSGDNLVISYTLPATDAGVRFKIALTAPNSAVGYFYVFPVTGSLNQTATISKADLFLQFGSHYSSYTGLIKSIDSADNQSAGVAFTVAQRPNPLLGITPIFTTTALVNGYNVSYTLPAGAVYAEVYQKYTSWSGVTPYDSFTGSYSSGGASGTNTVTLSNVLSNKGVSVTPLTGFIVVGTGIPENTYITNVSGNQITVNNNFTAQVSGSITGYGIVYSGGSPANISSTIYQPTYLLVRYYDDFENPSNYSAEQVVTPLQPVTVDISGPGNVTTVNTPTSGIDTSGTLGFNGFINLTWNAVTDTTLRGYRIRFTTDTTNPVYSYADFPIDQTNPPTGTVSYKLAGLAVGATYKIGVATYDEYNNTSSAYTDFSDATISGTPAITDYITAGNFQFGQGVDPTNLSNTGSGMKRGLFFDSSNYWFLNASNNARLKVGGTVNNYILWDGQKFTVDGDISARGGSFSGNVAMTSVGASIYNGTLNQTTGALVGDGFIFNRDGLLIRKGTNQVSLDTTNGAITANAGNIADWVIDSSKIERLDPSSTRYAGLSSTGLYKFWAGSTVSGGDISQFAVDRTGKVWASSVQISGGTLDIGPAAPNGFHVNSSGNLVASNVSLQGEIKAASGEITGNFIVKPTGSIIAGSGALNNADSVIIQGADADEYGGLAAFDSSGAALTEILTKPIDFGSTPRGQDTGATSQSPLPIKINFFTSAALIGGWVVGPTTFSSRDQQFVIDSTSTTNEIRVFGSSGGTNYVVKLGKPNSTYRDSNNAQTFIWAGPISGGTPGTPRFTVSQEGNLTAVNANLIGGTLSVSGTGETMKFGNSVNGALNGIYIDANDYWYSNGTAKFGNGTIEILTGGTVKFATGNIEFNNVGDFLSDENNYAGDPTITLNTSNKLTQGRRFIYNGTANPTSTTQPGSLPGWNGSTGVFNFKNNASDQRACKVGDLIFTT